MESLRADWRAINRKIGDAPSRLEVPSLVLP